MIRTAPPIVAPKANTAPPRLGFLGVGWIGQLRMQAVAEAQAATIAAIADPAIARAREAAAGFPTALLVNGLDALLALDLDGVVIATPSALHATQATRALEQGVAVFCQKPLGRDLAETQRVIAAARANDRLLGVDLSYRYTLAAQRVRDLVHTGRLGRIYAADLTFHNAHGPESPWFYQRTLSGGGCLIDLGIHLIDLTLWLLGPADVVVSESTLLRAGQPLGAAEGVEDYAVATLHLSSGAVVRLACSWRLSAGQDAIIEVSIYGTSGGATIRNVNGSFYDFTAAHHRGTASALVAEPPDAWGGRAAIAWAQRLSESGTYDPTIEELVSVAATLDRIYRR